MAPRQLKAKPNHIHTLKKTSNKINKENAYLFEDNTTSNKESIYVLKHAKIMIENT